MNYRFGIEEEYFVVSIKTGALQSRADDKFVTTAEMLTDGAVKRELLQSQVEVATPVCESFWDARMHLRHARMALGKAGRASQLTIMASGTHPTAHWALQEKTDKERYDPVVAELQMLAQRNLVCGLHVHVELPDPELQISVMTRILPYLPVLLALSTSSPFWQGRRTGFSSYRSTSYDEVPRSGLPPLFTSRAEFDTYVRALTDAEIIKDSSFIWWSIRPSNKFPTLELRISDTCTSLEDALTIAALYRCLVRRLVQQRSLNAAMSATERALVKENKWRAQRFGIGADLVDPFSRCSSIKAGHMAMSLIDFLREDARALDCLPEIERAADIVERGTSSDQQIALFEQALQQGVPGRKAMARVMWWLNTETMAGCGVEVPELEEN